MAKRPPSLLGALKDRLKHNEAYLSQSRESRAALAKMTYPNRPISDLWVMGEEAAIEAENEWINRLLTDHTP